MTFLLYKKIQWWFIPHNQIIHKLKKKSRVINITLKIQTERNKVEKITIETLISENNEYKYECLLEAKRIMKIEIWTDIRFLMVNKAITPGEITELIRKQIEIDKDINKWITSIQNAISAKR